ENLIAITVHTPFSLTLADGTVQDFPRGRHNVSAPVAEHWFTQAHAEIDDTAVPDNSDEYQARIETLKARIEERDATIRDLTSQLDEQKAQTEALNQQIAERLVGGDGDGKKPKPSNGK
uniref:STY1053 family phage-associated protein n=1 Tax=Candidatus Symbiopectobacterium sp. TaxID=2816440 RepID=UPI0025C666D9